MALRKRLTVLLLFGIVVCGAAYKYIDLFYARPVGSGPVAIDVPKSPFQAVWDDRKVHVLGIGDSITAGLGAKSKSHSYFERLIDNPDDEYPDLQDKCLRVVLPNLSSQNTAVSGSTSLQHMDRLSELSPYAEDVYGMVFITTGGNDLIHNYGRSPPREGAMYGASLAQAEKWIANFQDRLESMVAGVNALFPGGCEIYLADIYDPTDGVGDAPSIFLPDWPDGLAVHAQYNQRLRACASAHPNVFTVPLWETFLGHGSHCRQPWRPHYDASDPHYWYFVNIEDPNDRGYDAIRRVFLNTILDNSALIP